MAGEMGGNGGVRTGTIDMESMPALQPVQTPWRYFVHTTRCVLLGSRLNVLMLLTPVAAMASSMQWNQGLAFLLALLAIAPFAERLGYVTEQLAMHTNDTLGGLLNATFGNATEVIISLFALLKGRPSDPENTSPELYQRLVQVSLLGSVLSNLLLVLGSALLVGGLRYPSQNFNRMGSSVSTALLLLAAGACAMPWILESSGAVPETAVLPLSRFLSLLLVAQYCFFLNFQLRTHRHLYEADPALAAAVAAGGAPAVAAAAAAAALLDPTGELSELSSQRRREGFQIVRTNSIHIDSPGAMRDAGDRLRNARLQALPGAVQSELFKRRHTIAEPSALESGVPSSPSVSIGISGSASAGPSSAFAASPGPGPEMGVANGDVSIDLTTASERMKKSRGSREVFPGDNLEHPSAHAGAGPAATHMGPGSPDSIAGIPLNVVDDDDDDDEDELVLGFWVAIIWLAIISLVISVLSEYLVTAIKGAASVWNLSSEFMGAILIPVVGNAAEHASAIMFAYKNKMDIALGVALGSATQIAVSVLPFCVLLGWALGTPLTLQFEPFEVLALTISILTVGVIVRDGASHWLYGTVLVTAYAMISIAFVFYTSE
ncbi:Vacuolar cation/proton exchanger 3 [Hondaea fermentalgiana]|uniref:Vacuolar cation/proton exchanger 3 n=1 Tax=Hondaea fermentalgiana TaxID=2315210 RepID=A0A2R5GWR5_9STRA|nr:Vacuolar cation/proton exchanger 3 [Hondaea fermentalgiana]|eukprot:GBG32851.1 Vacuolar cation/proton exchanger 3 [Hondaea fermentalgiana]